MVINENSNISDDAKIFDGTRVVKCNIGFKCCIGQDCDLVNLTMSNHSELGRRNLIRDSSIGVGSYTGTNTVVKNSIIGKYCSISWNVSIGGGNHDYNRVSLYTNYWYNRTFGINLLQTNNDCKKTYIGNDVWIGAGVNIINGVTIGDGAVIGAGSVVTNDVPPYSIVMGVPAKCHKMRFSNEIISLLERIKWWDWPEEKIKENISLLQCEPTVEILMKYLENTHET